MPAEIAQRVRAAIAEKTFPGCVVGIVRKNGGREVMPFGRFAYDADSPEVRGGALYDLASVTKSIPVASLALTLIARSQFRLEDEASKFLPELRNDFGATVEDLLRYRVQGPQLAALKDKSADEILSHVFESGFSGPPAMWRGRSGRRASISAGGVQSGHSALRLTVLRPFQAKPGRPTPMP